MKKMIVAVLVVVVLFGLALAQPAVAPKKEKNPGGPKELGTLTLRLDLIADVTEIEDLRCGKKPSGIYKEGVTITLNPARDETGDNTDEAGNPIANREPWSVFEGTQGLGTVIIETGLKHFKLDNHVRFVFHFYLEDGLVFPDDNKPGDDTGPPWFSVGFFAERVYDQNTCTLTLKPETVDATIKEKARVVVWSGKLDLTLELKLG